MASACFSLCAVLRKRPGKRQRMRRHIQLWYNTYAYCPAVLNKFTKFIFGIKYIFGCRRFPFAV